MDGWMDGWMDGLDFATLDQPQYSLSSYYVSEFYYCFWFLFTGRSDVHARQSVSEISKDNIFQYLTSLDLTNN